VEGSPAAHARDGRVRGPRADENPGSDEDVAVRGEPRLREEAAQGTVRQVDRRATRRCAVLDVRREAGRTAVGLEARVGPLGRGRLHQLERGERD